MDDTPRMKPAKKIYEDMLNEPTRPSAGHTSKPMDMASKMYDYAPKQPKKMAGGGCCRGDGIAQRGKTRGKMV